MPFLDEYEYENNIFCETVLALLVILKIFAKQLSFFQKIVAWVIIFYLGPLHFLTFVGASDAENTHLD